MTERENTSPIVTSQEKKAEKPIKTLSPIEIENLSPIDLARKLNNDFLGDVSDETRITDLKMLHAKRKSPAKYNGMQEWVEIVQKLSEKQKINLNATLHYAEIAFGTVGNLRTASRERMASKTGFSENRVILITTALAKKQPPETRQK